MNERIPKIKKVETKNNLQPIDIKNRDVQNLLREINKTCLDTDFRLKWDLKEICMVHNSDLEADYIKKRTELKDEGRSSQCLLDQLGFLSVEHGLKLSIARNGLRTSAPRIHSLGKGGLGVSINRFFDIELKGSWRRPGKEKVDRNIFVFKYFVGRRKAIAVSDSLLKLSYPEPTPNFDCHISSLQPTADDTVYRQKALSSVYLYEYTEAYEASKCPRQCLPYAVIKCVKRAVIKPVVKASFSLKADYQSQAMRGPVGRAVTSSANEASSNNQKAEEPSPGHQNLKPKFDKQYVQGQRDETSSVPGVSGKSSQSAKTLIHHAQKSDSCSLLQNSGIDKSEKSILKPVRSNVNKELLVKQACYIERLAVADTIVQNERNAQRESIHGMLTDLVARNDIGGIKITSNHTQSAGDGLRDPRLRKVSKPKQSECHAKHVDEVSQKATVQVRPKKPVNVSKKMSYSEYKTLRSVDIEKKNRDKLHLKEAQREHASLSGLESDVDLLPDTDASNNQSCHGHSKSSTQSNFYSQFQSPLSSRKSSQNLFSQFQSHEYNPLRPVMTDRNRREESRLSTLPSDQLILKMSPGPQLSSSEGKTQFSPICAGRKFVSQVNQSPDQNSCGLMSGFQSPVASRKSSNLFSDFQSPLPPGQSSSSSNFQSPVKPQPSLDHFSLTLTPFRTAMTSTNNAMSSKPNTPLPGSSQSCISNPRHPSKKKNTDLLPLPVVNDDGSFFTVYRGVINGSIKEVTVVSCHSNGQDGARKNPEEKELQFHGNKREDSAISKTKREPPNISVQKHAVKKGANKLMKVFKNMLGDKKKKAIERQLSTIQKEECSISVLDKVPSKVECSTKQSEYYTMTASSKTLKVSNDLSMSTFTAPDTEQHATVSIGENLEIGSSQNELCSKARTADRSGKNGIMDNLCSVKLGKNFFKDLPKTQASVQSKNVTAFSDKQNTKHVKTKCNDGKKFTKADNEKTIDRKQLVSVSDNHEKENFSYVDKGQCVTSHTAARNDKQVNEDNGTIAVALKPAIILSKLNDSDGSSKCEMDKTKLDISTEHSGTTVSTCSTLAKDIHVLDLTLKCGGSNVDGMTQPLVKRLVDDRSPRFVCRSPNADTVGIHFSLDLCVPVVPSKNDCSPLRLIPSLCSDFKDSGDEVNGKIDLMPESPLVIHESDCLEKMDDSSPKSSNEFETMKKATSEEENVTPTSVASRDVFLSPAVGKEIRNSILSESGSTSMMYNDDCDNDKAILGLDSNFIANESKKDNRQPIPDSPVLSTILIPESSSLIATNMKCQNDMSLKDNNLDTEVEDLGNGRAEMSANKLNDGLTDSTLQDLGFTCYLQVLSEQSFQPSVSIVDCIKARNSKDYLRDCSLCVKEFRKIENVRIMIWNTKAQ